MLEKKYIQALYDRIVYSNPDLYKHELAKRDFIRRQIELSKINVKIIL